MTDSEILARAAEIFGGYARPEHFTDFAHCSECAEHNTLLRSRARGELRTEDVCNPGWNPICFVSNEAFLYLLPELMALAFAGPQNDEWSFPNLLFHLTYETGHNRYLALLKPQERAIVASFLCHIEETRAKDLAQFLPANSIHSALRLWKRRA